MQLILFHHGVAFFVSDPIPFSRNCHPVRVLMLSAEIILFVLHTSGPSQYRNSLDPSDATDILEAYTLH